MMATSRLWCFSFGSFFFFFLINYVHCFHNNLIRNGKSPYLTVYATGKRSKKVSRSGPTKAPLQGFGGAAAEPCPCGSGESYRTCCGKIHTSLQEFLRCTPEQLVRARYTAYSKRNIDFIIQSTHPENPRYIKDIQHWRNQIDQNCYDNFELTRCDILDSVVSLTNPTAKVTFVATMIQRDSRERTAFQEISTFARISDEGPWLYLDGVISDPPGRMESDATSELEDSLS
jgi:SEC-C motif domain protein